MTDCEGDWDETWVLRTEDGRLEATVAAFGATLVSLRVADARGVLEDVLLGHSRDVAAVRAAVADAAHPHPYFNCTVGRVCGRIGNGGRFVLDGVPVCVTANEGGGAKMLHGGARGFNTKLWRRCAARSVAGRVLCLETTSPDGDEGFPGTLHVAATFAAVAEPGARGAGLQITYEARLDAAGAARATVANLTNHFYVNLAPAATLGRGGITGHTLALAAAHYLPLDAQQLPVGTVAPVDAVMAFAAPRPVGARIRDVPGGVGYDHYYVLDDDCGSAGADPDARRGAMRRAAVLHAPESGRTLTLYTTQPGLVLYTANWIAGVRGKDGATYHNWDALCLETQGYPDAVHWPAFPSITLRKGEQLHHDTLLLFSAE